MKNLSLVLLMTAVIVPTSPVSADPPPWAPAYGRRAHEEDRHYRDSSDYYEPRVVTRRDYVWRGDDGRYHCRRSDGTTGLIVGAAAGALLGRAVDTRGDRATGTILGAAGGALLGKAIDSGQMRCK